MAVSVLPEIVRCRKMKMKMWISRMRTTIKSAHETPKVALCLASLETFEEMSFSTHEIGDESDIETHSLGENIQQ